MQTCKASLQNSLKAIVQCTHLVVLVNGCCSWSAACSVDPCPQNSSHLHDCVCMWLQAGSDVSASLTAWGSWQPALAPTRGPTVLDALIGSLGSRGSNRVSRCMRLHVFYPADTKTSSVLAFRLEWRLYSQARSQSLILHCFTLTAVFG